MNYRLVETAGREAGARTWIALRTRPGNVVDRSPMNVAFEIGAVDARTHPGRRLRAETREWAFHPRAHLS